MIEITEKAASEISKIKSKESLSPTTMLRVSVKGGGCSGLSYVLSFTDIKLDNDSVYTKFGESIIVDSKSLTFITGTVVDFESSIMRQEFTFNNPNSTSSCGCGSSFK